MTNTMQSTVTTQADNMDDPLYYDKSQHLCMASAGSGKTYRLAFEYLCLLLKDKYKFNNYKHVLAITFTNKATAEMKERILNNLELLANGNEDKDRDDLIGHIGTRLNIDAKEVTRRAQRAYSSLLHDYSHFNISTIDSFFQKVLRNMARELGLSSYWNLEMDNKKVLADATQEVFNNVKKDDSLRKWIRNYIQGKFEENKDWNIKKEVQQFGEHLFKEDFSTNEKIQEFLDCKDDDQTLRDKLSGIKDDAWTKIRSIEEDISNQVRLFDQYCADNGIEEGDFKKTILSFFKLLKAKTYEGSSFKTVAKYGDNIESNVFLAKTYKTKQAEAAQIAIYAHTSSILVAELQSIKTLPHLIDELGLLGDIRSMVRGILLDRGLFILNDTQPLLKKFTEDSDAPFIFERIGEPLRYIMIDEFQDTSKIQFENFEPLIKDCNAKNAYSLEENGKDENEKMICGSLLVGDPKQAIYRFRNGDWELICDIKGEGNRENQRVHLMGQNYRSAKNIVEFNNMIFDSDSEDENRSAIGQIDTGNTTEHLKEIYTDGKQEPVKKAEGYVKVLMHYATPKNKSEDNNEEESEQADWMLDAIKNEIERLKKNNVNEKDIAILLRKNKNIPLIAKHLNDNGYNVTSSEAFQLKASNKVRLIIDGLRYLKTSAEHRELSDKEVRLQQQVMLSDYQRLNPDKPCTEKDMADLCKKITDATKELPLYDTIEDIYRIVFENEPTDPFVQALFEKTIQYASRNIADISTFLNYWDESLKNYNIPVDSSSKTGIELMSIHKSKGLERHTIIIPYCNWVIGAEQGLYPELWCETDPDKDDTGLPATLEKFGTSMQASHPERYDEELAQLHADNINLLYVALTRASKNMIVIADDIDDGSKTKEGEEPKLPKDVGQLLYNCLSNKPEAHISEADKEVWCFEKGEIEPSKEEAQSKTSTNGVKAPVCDVYDNRTKFRQSSEAKCFILGKDTTAIEEGNLYHYIMQQIDHFEDIEHPEQELKAIMQIQVDRGYIESQDYDEDLNTLIHFFTKDIKQKIADWFVGGQKVLNEYSILCYDKEKDEIVSKRPDRVIYNEKCNTYTVVDYKTGKAKNEHIGQVQDYMKLIKCLHPESEIKGALWYMHEGKIVPVDL